MILNKLIYVRKKKRIGMYIGAVEIPILNNMNIQQGRSVEFLLQSMRRQPSRRLIHVAQRRCTEEQVKRSF